MSYDGNGNYSVPTGTQGVSGEVIDSVKYNALLTDLQTALTKGFLRDGQGAALANLPMGGYKLTGLASGTASSDSVTFGQLLSSHAAGITTGSGTAYVLSAAVASYTVGQALRVKFHAASGAAPTINVNSLGALNLVRGAPDGTISNLETPGLYPVIAANSWHDIVIVSSTQAVVLGLPPRLYTGTLSRDLTAASGNVATTGVGFKPRRIRFMSRVAGTVIGSDGEAGGSGNSCAYQTSVAASDNVSSVACIFAISAAAASQTAAVASFDADGFTLTWTKNNSPTGTLSVVFVAEE